MPRRLVVLVVALSALLVTSAYGGSLANQPTAASSDPPPNAPTLTSEEALRDDAQEFAKIDGVSVEEALRRLDLQLNVIPAFENAIAAGERRRYGGLLVQSRPSYRVVVLLTSGSLADVEPYITDERLSGLVEVRSVRRTYVELKSVQMRALHLRKVEDFDADIDITLNLVRLYVAATHESEVAAKAQALRGEAARSGDPLPDWVDIAGVPSLGRATLDIFGGLNLSDECTSGFSVTGPGNSGGVTTAAHCSDPLSYAGNPLTLKGQIRQGSYDIQWHSRTNTNFPAKIYRGQGVYGPITGKKARWNQPIGTNVCKRGIATDRTCGPITSKDFIPNWIPSPAATYIVADAGVAGGDSGGPVFVGDEAWGTVSGMAGGGDVVYMAANYVESSMGLYIRGT